MSGQTTSIPGFQWTSARQDLIAGLNSTALPVVRVDELAVSDRELSATDMLAIAGGITALPHLSYTFVSAIAVPAHATTDLVTIGWTGAVAGKFIITSDPGYLLFDIFAYVVSTNSVKLIARNYGNVDGVTVIGNVIKLVRV